MKEQSDSDWSGRMGLEAFNTLVTELRSSGEPDIGWLSGAVEEIFRERWFGYLCQEFHNEIKHTAGIAEILISMQQISGFDKLHAALLETRGEVLEGVARVEGKIGGVQRGIDDVKDKLGDMKQLFELLHAQTASGKDSDTVTELLLAPESEAFASQEVRESLIRHNNKTAFALDDGVVLYAPPEGKNVSIDGLEVCCDNSVTVPAHLDDPTPEHLLRLNHNCNADPVAAFLRREAKLHESHMEKELNHYQTKVGIREIEFPLERLDKPLKLHVEPLSYWSVLKFNRALLKRPSSELLALRHQSLADIFQPDQKVRFSCPSALYVEASIVSSDSKLVVVEKNDHLSVLAQTGKRWTCTLEEGLVWHKDVHDGNVLFTQALERGLLQELSIAREEIAKIEFYAIALEHTHLNTAILGSVRLNLPAKEIRPKVSQSEDFGKRCRFVSMDSAMEEMFEFGPKSEWHPTGRMRALLTLYSAFGREYVWDYLIRKHRISLKLPAK